MADVKLVKSIYTGSDVTSLGEVTATDTPVIPGAFSVTGLNTSGSSAWTAASELTIASGTVTITQSLHRIDTEGDAAIDELDTISGSADGKLLAIRAEHADRTVVIKHNTGNIYTDGTDISLGDTSKYVLFAYDGALTKWVVIGGAGSGGGLTKAVHQHTHGFAVGDCVYLNSGTYTKGIASTAAAAELVGMVSAVAGTDDFTLAGGGWISGLSGLTAGTVYFLSGDTAGAMTATEPVTEGYISKPCFIADSATSGYFFNMRGAVIGSGSGGVGFATAAEITTGTEAAKAIAPDQLKLAGIIPANIFNLKPVVNAAVNKLDIFTKSGGAVPDATNPIRIMIPDGNGNTLRSRADAYLSGTSQFIMADATNYWNKGSLNAEIKTAWLYAIWDGTGIVWALSGYSGFNVVPTTTTVTDDDYFLLEASSTYTRSASHRCVAVGKIRYQYDTADTPDHTIQATVIDAPQVIWNPKSDYTRTLSLAADNVSGSDIASYSAVSVVVKQPGKYKIVSHMRAAIAQVYGACGSNIRTGSASYGSAVIQAVGDTGLAQYNANAGIGHITLDTSIYLNYGDTIHLGVSVTATTGSGNLTVCGGAGNFTGFTFTRAD